MSFANDGSAICKLEEWLSDAPRRARAASFEFLDPTPFAITPQHCPGLKNRFFFVSGKRARAYIPKRL